MSRLKDKVAVITGSGMGLGQGDGAAIQPRRRQNCRYRHQYRGWSGNGGRYPCKEGGDAIFVRADVSNGDDAERMIAAAVESYGGVDVLVNNAGVQVEKNVPDTTEEEWDYVLGVNLKGTFLCSRAAIPQMRRQGGGSIICISSISGLVGQPNQASYNASKHGVIGLVRAMACDHTQEGIRVNAICPGSMNTPMAANIPEEHLAPYRKANLFERFAEPIEVAYAASILGKR